MIPVCDNASVVAGAVLLTWLLVPLPVTVSFPYPVLGMVNPVVR